MYIETPNIYQQLEEFLLDSYLSQGYKRYVKYKLSHGGFELVSPCPYDDNHYMIPHQNNYCKCAKIILNDLDFFAHSYMVSSISF